MAGIFNATFKNNNDTFNAQFGQTQFISTNDYNDCFNKPKINGVELIGDKTSHDIKVQDEMNAATVAEIEAILYLDI